MQFYWENLLSKKQRCDIKMIEKDIKDIKDIKMIKKDEDIMQEVITEIYLKRKKISKERKQN